MCLNIYKRACVPVQFFTTDVTDCQLIVKAPFLVFNSISEECREVERQSRENGRKKEQAHLTDRPHSSLIGGEREAGSLYSISRAEGWRKRVMGLLCKRVMQLCDLSLKTFRSETMERFR